jgi:nitric oxide reductase large subunit
MEKESSKNTLIIFISITGCALLMYISLFIYDLYMFDKENKDLKIKKNPIYNGFFASAITNLVSFLIIGLFVVYTYSIKEISLNLLFVSIGLIIINYIIRLLLTLIIDAKQKNIDDNNPNKFNDLHLQTSIMLGILILLGISLIYFYNNLQKDHVNTQIIIDYLNTYLKELTEHHVVKKVNA